MKAESLPQGVHYFGSFVVTLCGSFVVSLYIGIVGAAIGEKSFGQRVPLLFLQRGIGWHAIAFQLNVSFAGSSWHHPNDTLFFGDALAAKLLVLGAAILLQQHIVLVLVIEDAQR